MALTQIEKVTDHITDKLDILDRDAQKSFRDNLEHLEFIEKISKVRLAEAYLRGGNPSPKGPQSSVHAAINRLLKDGSAKLPDLSFLGADLGKMTLADLNLLIRDLTKEMNDRVRNSLREGVDLAFETFCSSFNLDEIERMVLALMISNNTSKSFRKLYDECRLDENDLDDGSMSIGVILSIVFPSYREQIRGRRYFSTEAPLMKHQIIIPWLHFDSTTNVLDMTVHLHERVVRFVLGDDNQYDTDLECISKVKSTVTMDQVILPTGIKEEVLRLARKYNESKERGLNSDFEKFYGYGTGLTFFFHGVSGTGKTMLAHALSTSLEMPLLSVDLGKADHMRTSTEDIIKYAFREAKLCNGILFFDECDDVFIANSSESRTLLVELEKSECITILATNKAIELDPALDRRITMKVPFRMPDEGERESIWKALVPPNVSLDPGLSLKNLAREYVFTGGQIKNTVFMASMNAAFENGDGAITLTNEAIEKAAGYQATTIFDLDDIELIYEPEISIDQLSIRSRDRKTLHRLADICKRIGNEDSGLKLLIGSNPRLGVMCAQAVARECGLKVREYWIWDILFNTEGSQDEVLDPFTQKKMTRQKYAFRAAKGFRSLSLFWAPGFDVWAKKSDEGTSRFFNEVSQFRGILLLVTKTGNPRNLPPEFDGYIEISPLPEELQIRQWEKYLGASEDIREKIVRLVERYPKHLEEIDEIARRAKISSMIRDKTEEFSIGHVLEVINRSSGKKMISTLFGKGVNDLNNMPIQGKEFRFH